jgi:hypothetical protein
MMREKVYGRKESESNLRYYKKKVNLFLYLIKHYAMKVYEDVEVWLLALLTFV